MEIIRGKIEALNESQKKQKSEEKSGLTARERFIKLSNAKEVEHPGGVKVRISGYRAGSSRPQSIRNTGDGNVELASETF